MDQIKIGKFILELRKEKNMTQQELANQLGVTDRAISKWENGRGLPDLSLLKPLCDTLNITINELLSGEKLNRAEYINKSEENIIKTINYTEKKLNRTKKTFKIIITIILIVIISLVVLLTIDINRMKNQKPVFFSTWGFDYAPPVDLKDEKITNSIINYIVANGDNESKRYENEKTFASMKVYLIEEKKAKTKFYVYSWVLEERHYLENNEIKESSGSSIPHKFTVEKINDKYVVTDSKTPRDGSYYVKDMKNLFPKDVRKEMEKVHQDGTIKRLMLDIDNQTKLYFHK